MTESENNNHFKPRIQPMNPFKHKLYMNTFYNYIKLTFMSIFVLPIRVIGILICLVTAYIIASLALWGITDEELEAKPLQGWRSKVRWYMFALGRTMIRFYGYTYVKVKGECASAEEAPIIVTAPHSSFFDGIAVWWTSGVLPGIVSRAENNDVPLFGKCIRFIQSVHVERQDVTSRKSTLKAIMDRVNSKENWPPILIFPEGTCTNGQSLISFKLGAFLPGVPVQPMIIRYKNKNDCTTWTVDGPGALKLIWASLCQFHSFCEVEYLPVYTPSLIEKEDAYIYANNVRNVMAKVLGLPVTSFSLEDAKLMDAAKKNELPSEFGLIDFQQFRRTFGLELGNIREDFLSQFAKMSKLCNRNGLVDIHGFASGLYLPISEPLVVKLFNLYDEGGRGTLNFEEYIFGRCSHTERFRESDLIEKTYPFFGCKSFENISFSAFSAKMNTCFNVTLENVCEIFKLADPTDKRFISEEGYNQLAKRAPEYLWIIYGHLQNIYLGNIETNSALAYHKSKPE